MQSLTENEYNVAAIHYIKGSININSNADKVWEVLTDPGKIKQYTGAETKTDWEKGSPITWEAEQGGVKYQDKGTILENEPLKTLQYSYWSSAAGLENSAENNSVITWSLEHSMEGLTTLTYQRENIPTLEERAMFEEFLPGMLDEIKRMAEA